MDPNIGAGRPGRVRRSAELPVEAQSALGSHGRMHPVPLLPIVHLFVCANRRPTDAPLGPGCGEAGEAVYRALKEEVAKAGLFTTVWVTQTLCLGICPKRGASVAVYPAQRVLTEVVSSEAEQLFVEVTTNAGGHT
jgi:(2Fe-2S) ferredoxin